jgi:opacity protein-like surface antigen
MNQMDKVFRSKLEHYTVDTPSETWESIQSKLPEKKNIFNPWLVAAILAIVFASVTTYRYFDQTPCTPSNQHTVQETIACRNNLTLPDKVKNDSKNQEQMSFYTDSDNHSISNEINIENRPNEMEVSLITGMEEGSNKIDELGITDAGIDFVPDEMQEPTNVKASDIVIAQNGSQSYEQTNCSQNDQIVTWACPSSHVICPQSPLSNKRLSVECSISHDYAPKSLSSNDGAWQDYMNLRKSTEKALYSYTLGLGVAYDISEKWAIQSGINYTQVRESFQYPDPEYSQTREITIKDYVYQNGKIVDSIVNTQIVTIPGNVKIDVKNQYNTWTIPIMARFKIHENRDLTVSATTGVCLDIAYKYSGKIFDQDKITILDIAEASHNTEQIFNHNIGMGVYGGLQIAYHIMPKVAVILEPFAKIQTNHITNDAYVLQQKYNTYGLKTGIRYSF